jgi:hypothetical protein
MRHQVLAASQPIIQPSKKLSSEKQIQYKDIELEVITPAEV